MADINEILGRQINSVRELKSAISDLQNSLIGLDTESEEFKTTSQQLAAAQEELTKVTRAGKEENVAATDSLVGMQREYKELYNTYKMLSDEQRNSDFGKQMAASLDELSTKINETKQGVGNFTSNIGNYTNSAISAFKQMGQAVQGLNSPLKLAGGGAKALGQSLKALIANPVGAVIMAIVIALKGMQEALKRSEEAQRKFNQALEAFKPVADFVLQIFEALVEVISDVIKWVGDFTTNLLGLENNAKNAASAVDTLAVANAKLAAGYAEMDLYDQNRKQTIQDLREQLEATKDLAKKQEILNQIKQLQATIDENAQIKAHNAVSQALTDLKFYQEELERAIQLEAEGKITAEELADAKIKLANAQEAYNKALKDESAAQYTARKNTEKLDKEIKNLGKSTKSTAKATENLAEKAKNLYENIVENSKTEIQKVTDKYEKEKKLLEKYHYDTTLLTKKYNEDISKIIKKEEDKRRSAYLNGLKQAGADYKAELDLILKRDGEFIATVEQQDLLQYKIIPAVREVRKEIDDLIFSIADGDTLKEIVNLLNTEGFAGLGEDYADIKNKIEEINAEYGLSITTLKNLDLTIENLNDRNKELTNNLFSATFAEVTAERLVDAYEWAFEEIKEL